MGMMDYGLMSGTGFWTMSVVWLVYIALAAFIFGIIFWLTYKLVMKK